MLTLMPMLEAEDRDPATGLGGRWHSEGALSRRQPGVARQEAGVMVGSRNWSLRTEVSSTPQRLLRPLVSVTPEWQPAGLEGLRLVHVGPRVMVWPAPLDTEKCPVQLAPFWSQNCGSATLV